MAFSVEVKKSPGKGRGVFATAIFQPKDIIEICPVIVIPKADFTKIDNTIFDTYVYDWFDGDSCIPVGYGLIYNHSYSPNARYYFHKSSKTISYRAIKPIHPGEEIFVNYNGVPTCLDPLDGFDF